MATTPSSLSTSILLMLLTSAGAFGWAPAYYIDLSHSRRRVEARATTSAVDPMCADDHLFVFGAGYVGLHLCRAARARFGPALRISASCRAGPGFDDRAARLLASGCVDDAHAFDLDISYSGLGPDGRRALGKATHVVCTVAPVADFGQDPLLALHGGGALMGAASCFISE